MKEATGELNMTVVTVVAIAAVGALFTIFLWPRIRANIILSTACSNVDANGNYTDNSLGAGANDGDQGGVNCANWTCEADYQGRHYERDCHAN